MDTLLQDIKYGFRLLFKNPGITVIAVIALSLGIGANTAIFSVVNSLLLKPLPYANSERLTLLNENSARLANMSVSYLNFIDWREQNQSFEYLAASRFQPYNMTSDGNPERVLAAQVSADMFGAIGVQPFMGRAYTEADDKPGAERTAVLTYAFWQERFGAQTDIIGQTITLSGNPYTVIGVFPQDFRTYPRGGTQVPQLWTPLGLMGDVFTTRGNHPGIYVTGLLKPGVTLEQAQTDMSLIAKRLEEQYPQSNTGNGIRVRSLHEVVVGDSRTPLFILLGAVGFVLLIACANVANLLLVRAAVRTREISVRVALGAGRMRIVRQMLTESTVLAIAGGVFGVFLAYWGINLLVAATAEYLPRINEVYIDKTVLAFTALLAVVTGIIFGLAPALQSSSPDLNDALKDSVRGTTGGRNRLRNVLVVAEVSLAMVLLIGAGLLIRSFWQVSGASPGFNPDDLLTVNLTLPQTQYPDAESRRAFYNRLYPRLNSMPGVIAAGTIIPLPLGGGGWQTSFAVDGRERPAPGEFPLTDIARVSPGYFKTMGIPLLKGREFNERDHEEGPLVTIIDEQFAKKHFPDEDPIGQRLVFGPPQNPIYREIVGIVGHVKNYGVDEESRVEMYQPYLQSPTAPITLLLRSKGDPNTLGTTVRNIVREIDPSLPVYNIRTMSSLVTLSIADRQLAAVLLTIFAAVALALASVGIYGVMSYAVSQRTHEIGIRMALGAGQGQVLGMVVRQGMALVGLGLLIGIVGSYGMTRWLESVLFNVSATDPMVFLAIPVILAVVALLASYIPARRAARVDPMVALRYE